MLSQGGGIATFSVAATRAAGDPSAEWEPPTAGQGGGGGGVNYFLLFTGKCCQLRKTPVILFWYIKKNNILMKNLLNMLFDREDKKLFHEEPI